MLPSKYLLLYFSVIFFLLLTFPLSSATFKPHLIIRNKHGIPNNPETPTTPPAGNANPPPSDNKSPPIVDQEDEFDPIADDKSTGPNNPPGNAETPPGGSPTQESPTTPPGNKNAPESPPGDGKSAESSGGIDVNVQVNFKGSFSKVFAFGDSFTDTGNAQLLGSLKSFVGKIISQLISARLGDEKLQGFRQCNGKLMVDFLCDDLGLPYLPPFKNESSDFSSGCNFAIGGATALASEFLHRIINTTHSLMWNGTPPNFQTEVDWFNKFLQDLECKGKDEKTCKEDIANGLFWIGDMGGNDYARILGSSGSPFSMKSLAETTCGLVTKLLTVGLPIYLYILLCTILKD